MSWLCCRVSVADHDDFIKWVYEHTKSFEWEDEDRPTFVCWIWCNTPKDQMYAKLRWG